MKTIQIGMGWFPEQAGGLNRVYYDCAQYLPQAGIEIQGLVSGSPHVSQITQKHIQSFAPIKASLLQRWWKVRCHFKSFIKDQDNCLVVSHFCLYTFPILDLLGDHPVVMHFQGPWAREGRVEGGGSLVTRAKWLIEWVTYQKIQRFIVLSEAFKQILHQEYHIPKNCIHVIPPGVDTTRFDVDLSQLEARQRLGWAQDRPIILAVRRLARRMGLENLVASMVQVCKSCPDALLLIAGKGSLVNVLEQQIETLGLKNNVRLLGFVSDEELSLAYRAANFSVVPTVALEGFGLIVTESLANGTPVLGTPVDSIPEILKPLSPDLLFEGIEPEQIAIGIIESLNGKRCLPSSEVCREYVRQNYDWSIASDRIKAVYQQAMDEYAQK